MISDTENTNTNPLEGTEWYYRGFPALPQGTAGAHIQRCSMRISTRTLHLQKHHGLAWKPHCYHPFSPNLRVRSQPAGPQHRGVKDSHKFCANHRVHVRGREAALALHPGKTPHRRNAPPFSGAPRRRVSVIKKKKKKALFRF